jgi:hypothetical protein
MIFSPLWSTAQSHLDGRTLWCKTPNDCGEIEGRVPGAWLSCSASDCGVATCRLEDRVGLPKLKSGLTKKLLGPGRELFALCVRQFLVHKPWTDAHGWLELGWSLIKLRQVPLPPTSADCPLRLCDFGPESADGCRRSRALAVRVWPPGLASTPHRRSIPTETESAFAHGLVSCDARRGLLLSDRGVWRR